MFNTLPCPAYLKQCSSIAAYKLNQGEPNHCLILTPNYNLSIVAFLQLDVDFKAV